MSVGVINHVAVLVAAVASWLFGAAYYGVLAKQWMAALGKTKAELMPSGQPNPLNFIVSFIAQVVMAEMLAGSIAHLGPGQLTVKNALISAAFIWAGFVLTVLVTTHGYQGSKRALTLIDGAHWLGVLLLQGLVLGLMGS
jgi:Protein of unknown function (DUF1761)